MKYDSNGIPQWAKTTVAGGSTAGARYFGLAVSGNRTAVAVGTQNDPGTVNYGDGVTVT